MKIPSLMNRRRYSFGKVFWITLAIYLFFLVVGLVAMYLSPTMNTAPNWSKIFSFQHILSQVVGLAFFALFYFFKLHILYSLISGKHKPTQFVQPLVLAFLLLGVYYFISFRCFTPDKLEISGNSKAKDEFTLGVMIFTYVISSIFVIGFSFLVAYLTYL